MIICLSFEIIWLFSTVSTRAQQQIHETTQEVSVDHTTTAAVDSFTELHDVDNIQYDDDDDTTQQHLNVSDESSQVVVSEHADKQEASFDAGRPAAMLDMALSERNALTPRAFYGSKPDNFQLAKRCRRVPARFAE